MDADAPLMPALRVGRRRVSRVAARRQRESRLLSHEPPRTLTAGFLCSVSVLSRRHGGAIFLVNIPVIVVSLIGDAFSCPTGEIHVPRRGDEQPGHRAELGTSNVVTVT
jgi:hypothetical protein